MQIEGTLGGRCSADRGYFWWAMQCRQRVLLVGVVVQTEGTFGGAMQCRQRVLLAGAVVQAEDTFDGRCSTDRRYFWWAFSTDRRYFWWAL